MCKYIQYTKHRQMAINLGTESVTTLYLGEEVVTAIYLGEEQVI